MNSRMFSAVQHHRRPLREALSTDVANVRSFAYVGQQMNLLRAKATEGFPANGT